MKTPIILIIIFLPIIGWTQSHKFYEGLGIEIGLGYNKATWKVDDYQNIFGDTTFHRKEFWLKPSIRISYTFPIVTINEDINLKLKPFIGYYAFGGKSRVEPNGYRDYVILRSIEMGIFPTLELKNKIQFSIAAKGQYIFDSKIKYFGTLYQSSHIPREWETEDGSDLFKDFSMNYGLRLGYRINKVVIGIEGWFGFVNLSTLSSDLIELRIIEHNFRLMIGIEL